MQHITSLTNAKVKSWLKLKNKKERDTRGLFFVEGDHLVLAAHANNLIKELIVREGHETKLKDNPYYVTKDILKKLSTLKTPPNIMAVCYQQEPKELGKKLILLDNIQDPANLGVIIRSAVAFNFDTIVLGNGTVDLYNPKVINATEGMIFNINILRANLIEMIPQLKQADYQILGTKSNGLKLKMLKIKSQLAILFGNEGNGLNPELLNLCDQVVSIPLNKQCESLNVATAASIIMYEIEREEG